MESVGGLDEYTSEELESITNGFSAQNFFGNTQFGKVFRGKFNVQFAFLDDFKWVARIKVALGFACLLDVLHGEELLLRNIDAAHVMVDKAFNPRLLDFSMLVGEVFGGILPYEYFMGCHGYRDPYICETGKREYDIQDQVCLLRDWGLGEFKRHKSKSLFCNIPDWARGEYKSRKSKSLAHKSFEIEPFFDACDGVEITKLALRCILHFPRERPTMKEVVQCLQ